MVRRSHYWPLHDGEFITAKKGMLLMSTDTALLLIRLLIGLIMAAHGAQKLFGWFGGRGFDGALRLAVHQRLRPAPFWAVMAGLTELNGVLLAVGLLGPVGELGVIASMTMAIITAHWPRFFVTNNGLEYPLVLLVTALALAISGPGAYSLDALLRLTVPEPATLIVGLAALALGTAVALGTRVPQQHAAQQATI